MTKLTDKSEFDYGMLAQILEEKYLKRLFSKTDDISDQLTALKKEIRSQVMHMELMNGLRILLNFCIVGLLLYIGFFCSTK